MKKILFWTCAWRLSIACKQSRILEKVDVDVYVDAAVCDVNASPQASIDFAFAHSWSRLRSEMSVEKDMSDIRSMPLYRRL